MSKTVFRLWTGAKGKFLIRRRIRFCAKSKLQCGLDAASGWLKGRVHVIFVAVKKENWGGLSRKFGTKSWLVCVQNAEIFASSSETIHFPVNNFLFSQKQLPTKLPHSLKHITYCPPKSRFAFWYTLPNPCAVKPPSRTGSKYSELYGTRLRVPIKTS